MVSVIVLSFIVVGRRTTSNYEDAWWPPDRPRAALRQGLRARPPTPRGGTLSSRADLGRGDPAEGRWQAALADALSQRGDCARHLNQAREALEDYRASLEIYEELSERDPSNLPLRGKAASALENLGAMSMKAGDVESGLGHLERSAALSRELAEADGANPTWRIQLQDVLGWLTEARLVRGDVRAAFDAAREALEIAHANAARDPDNIEYKASLARSHWHIGRLYGLAARHAAAAHHMQASVDISRLASAGHPESLYWLEILLDGLNGLGSAQADRGTLEAASQTLAEASATLENMTTLSPGNPGLIYKQYLMARRLASIRLAQDDRKTARTHMSRCLDLIETLLELDGNLFWRMEAVDLYCAMIDLVGDNTPYRARLAELAGSFTPDERALLIFEKQARHRLEKHGL